jgi:hypothetical protein
MRRSGIIGAIILFAAILLEGQSKTERSDSCLILQQALADYQQLKVGMTRRELETNFQPDGGLQFTGSTRYLYKKCLLLQIKVDFAAIESAKQLPSPADKVSAIAELSVAYPAKD